MKRRTRTIWILAIGALALSSAPRWANVRAIAQEKSRELVVVAGEGTWGQGLREGFLEDFSRTTGIKIRYVGGGLAEQTSKLKAMASIGHVEWDLVSGSEVMVRQNPDLYATVQCDKLPNVAKNLIAGSCKPFGVLLTVTAHLLAYNPTSYAGKPKGWDALWDQTTYPGRRGMPNYGSPEFPIVMALLADGVKPKDLVPFDLDRAFRKLDQIKPHVAVWWKSGDQSVQAFRSGEYTMSWLWTSRVKALESQGFPVKTVRSAGFLDEWYWLPVRNGPNPEAVTRFLDYFAATRPEGHAKFFEITGYQTPLRGIEKLIPEKDRHYVFSEEELASYVKWDAAWVARAKPQLVERWNTWISK